MKFFILVALATVGLAAPAVVHYNSHDQYRVEVIPNTTPNDAHVRIAVDVFGSSGGKDANAAADCRVPGESK